MYSLSSTWFSEGLIDLEYKQYVLKAYLQQVLKRFQDHELYPFFMELITHRHNLQSFLESKEAFAKQLPRAIEGIDPENWQIRYKKLIEDSELMQELEQIVQFAIPEIEKHLEQGKALYEWVEDQLIIEPIGILPIQRDLGYFFLKMDKERETRVFEYQVTIYQSANTPYRALRTDFIGTFSLSIARTVDSLKHELLATRDISNPATFLVNSAFPFPVESTLLPVSKRVLIRYLANLQ